MNMAALHVWEVVMAVLYVLDQTGSTLVQAAKEVKAFAMAWPWTPPPQKETSDNVSTETYQLERSITWE